MHKFNPLVSIVIPVYNGSDFLSSAINSALSQSYKNIEIIVVNDGSVDDNKTEEIALSFGDRIRYFLKPNGGVATALNLGILEMKGDYFSWLSHDDLYSPDKIQFQVDYLSSLDDKEVVLYSDYMNVDEKNNDLYPVCMDHGLLNEKPLYSVLRGALHGCSLLVPRNVFSNTGIFNDLRTTQDYDLWFRMVRKYQFIHIDKILVRSRLHPNQGSRNIDATDEANMLWIRMMRSLTPSEILNLEPSEKAFFEGMAGFLASTPYLVALDYAKRMALEPSCEESVSDVSQASIISSSPFCWRLRTRLKNFLRRLNLLEYSKKIHRKFCGALSCSSEQEKSSHSSLSSGGTENMQNDNRSRSDESFIETCKILQRIIARG